MTEPPAVDGPQPVYDSAAIRTPLATEVRNFWRYRGLIKLLVQRELTVRYKRSVLGAGWSILQPLLETAILWAVFSAVFGRTLPDGAPFIVYLLSGILIVTFFRQGVVAAGSAMVNHANILSKVYVPPEVFAYTTTVSAGVNFLIMLVPLTIVQLATGIGIPWTFPLLVLPAFAMLLLATGLGLVVAAAAVRFYDVIPLTQVLTQLLYYLTPTFYPLEMLEGKSAILTVIKVNPLYSFVTVTRQLAYGGYAEPWHYGYMLATSVVCFVLGVWVFSRSWRSLVVQL